jgi:hypothetical protein
LGGYDSVTGASTATNFASTEAYFGIFDYNVTTGTTVSNPYGNLTGSATGSSTYVTGDWTPVSINGLTYYYADYVLTVDPGETHILALYASGASLTGSGTGSTPAPAALLPMAAGIVGLAARRHRATR